MNISNHFYQRYHERVRTQSGPFVDSLKERYSKEIDLLYNSCEKIYSGVIGHSSRPVDVYVNSHGWVIISNDNEKTLVTVYKIDLGVGDDELNNAFILRSLARIDEIRTEIEQSEAEFAEQKQTYRNKIATNDEKIKELNQLISKLKAENASYSDLIKLGDTQAYQAKIKLRDTIENYMVKDAVKIDLD